MKGKFGMAIKPLEINSKIIQIMKPVTSADYTAKTILTNSAWEYVELILKRKKSKKAKRALFYWRQSWNFFKASECLPVEFGPLTSYYCCLNATKALLAIKGSDSIDFDKLSHGISSDKTQWKNTNLKDAQVVFSGSGVLLELSKYLSEVAIKETYTIYNLLYNIPCIHRTFSITYQCPELFIPVRDVKFIIDTELKKGWMQFNVDERYANGNSLKYVPKHFEKVNYQRSDDYSLM